MKIVDRKTFLTLPSGTVFAQGQPWVFGTLCIKYDSLENDWYQLNPCWIEHSDCDEYEILEQMLIHKSSHPMRTILCRDGCYAEDDVFLVFELNDLHKLRDYIDNAIKISST